MRRTCSPYDIMTKHQAPSTQHPAPPPRPPPPPPSLLPPPPFPPPPPPMSPHNQPLHRPSFKPCSLHLVSWVPQFRSPSFDLMQRRVVGEKATAGRSLASLHLHSTGGGCCSDKRNGEGLTPFHAYMCEMGPGQYTPDMCAPPLLSQAGRRRHRNQSSSLDCCC